MKAITLETAKKTEFKNLSIALGTFDGLHTGHMALIDAVKGFEGQSAVFTFDSLPSDIFLEGHKPMYLFTLEEKVEAFSRTDIDYLCITNFDRRFAAMEKDDFLSMLINTFRPVNIVAGYNYTYGKHAAGDVDTLQEYGERQGFNVVVIPPVISGGEPVSSTRIRECIEAGSMERANTLLGYNYSVSGIVEKGEGLGSQLGFPTANITAAKGKILPLRGVYSVDVIVSGGSMYKGVCNIGVRPTVSAGIRETIEVHIISLARELYGEKITIVFNKRLREEMRFTSREELINQIKRDVKCRLDLD